MPLFPFAGDLPVAPNGAAPDMEVFTIRGVAGDMDAFPDTVLGNVNVYPVTASDPSVAVAGRYAPGGSVPNILIVPVWAPHSWSDRGREAINSIYNTYLKTLHYTLEINC